MKIIFYFCHNLKYEKFKLKYLILQTSNSKKISAIKPVSNTDHIKYKDRNEEKYRPKARSSLTEREKEQRRQEMMANAVWRDKEREKNVKIYREQEKKEEQTNTLDNKDFIRYVIKYISHSNIFTLFYIFFHEID